MNKENKPKKEFSKKIFNIVITLFIIVIFYAMALMWKTENTDALAYLIPSVSGLSVTCCGFYFWKAKVENVKYGGLYTKLFLLLGLALSILLIQEKLWGMRLY